VVSQIKVGERGHAYVVGSQGRPDRPSDISLVFAQHRHVEAGAGAGCAGRTGGLGRTGSTGAQASQAVPGRAAPAPPPPRIAAAKPDSLEGALNIQGQEVLTASAPIAPLGWIMFRRAAGQGSYASLYQALQRLALVLTGASIFAVLAGIFLARRMVGPIQVLRAGAARIGGGDFTQRISIKTGDELEGLANQFNDMGARLQESYSDLEGKVEQRTAELSESLEQQTATSEVLEVISSSPGELEPVFKEDARERHARLRREFRHDESVGRREVQFRRETTMFHAAYAARRQQSPITPHPEKRLATVVRTHQAVHIQDLRKARLILPETRRRQNGRYRRCFGPWSSCRC